MGIKQLQSNKYPNSLAVREAFRDATRNTGTGANVAFPEGDRKVFVNHKGRETFCDGFDLGVACAGGDGSGKPASNPAWGTAKAMHMTEDEGRRLVAMREQGATWREIKEEFGCSVPTARKRYDRAKALLRK